MKILVWTPGWRDDSGGVIALHRLCFMLREQGANASLWGPQVEDCYGNPYASVTDTATSECTVVYPEIVSGDPLGAKKVVRWLLNVPGRLAGDGKFAPDDLIITYARTFHPTAPEVFVFDLFPEHIHANGTADRSGGIFIVRKGAHKPRLPAIDGENFFLNGDETKPANFGAWARRSKRCYSYDAATWLSVQAVLCGCESYVVPDEGVSAQQWRDEHWLFRVGVGYGLDDKHGIRTAHLLKPWLEECEQRSIRSVDWLANAL